MSRSVPSFTEEQWVEKFKSLLPQGNMHDDKARDWVALFLEYIRSTPAEYKSLKSFMDAKKIAIPTLNGHSGGTFWNRARQSVQAKALAIALDKSPQLVAKKYEKQLRIVSKLEDAIEHMITKIRKDQEAQDLDPLLPVNPFTASAVDKLIDGVSKLVETNILLNNDGVQKHEVKSLNLHASLVEAIKQRDQQFGLGE